MKMLKSLGGTLRHQIKYPFYLAGEPVYSSNLIPITNKFTLEKFSNVCLASKEDIQKAISFGYKAVEKMSTLSSFERKQILIQTVSALKERKTQLADILCFEAGKPINDALGEVSRCIETFEIAAEESIRINGEFVQYDISAAHKGYQGIHKRFPIGLISMISPFNFPLNLAAHKIAPAIASGCPFLLKPSILTPISAVVLGEILSETNLPKEAFSILPCQTEDASPLIEDDRIKLLSFTGSPEVGWLLKEKCRKKKIVLELGGNAACIVDKKCDIDDVVKRVIFGAFYQSGQSCISVQRLYVHFKIYDEFKVKLIHQTEKLVVGNPSNSETFIGPIISQADAERCASWIKEAITKGATLITGGNFEKNLLEPTIVENVPSECKLSCKEVFGPVCTIEKFTKFDEAIKKVNQSDFGLQAGVFTKNIDRAFYAFEKLQVGGVVINDVPSKRIDSMPYGGIKNSGIGREGVKNSIEDMTEIKLMLMRNIGQNVQ